MASPLYHVDIHGPFERIRTDFVVMGAGVAGLRAAIELAPAGRVLVLSKDSLRESSSEYAAGGLTSEPEPNAADALGDAEASRILFEEAPAALEELMEWGARRDSSGCALAHALRQRARSFPGIAFQSFAALTDVLLDDGEAVGVAVFDEMTHSTVLIEARAVLLATGGLGRVFENTTNPAVATGDGVAAAFRAGAAIADLEFVEFHPTALSVDAAPRLFLGGELRAAGGYLRNARGERFLERYHPLGEMAPPDVLARSIALELRASGGPCVFLDMTHLAPGLLRERFTDVYRSCLTCGINLETMPAPVAPAAHYSMGGIKTDLSGRTTVPRLFAAGEVACSGVHGARGPACHSLLECVVFAARTARAMRETNDLPALQAVPEKPLFPSLSEPELRAMVSNGCGVLRDGDELEEMHGRLSCDFQGAQTSPGRASFELRNMHQVALLLSRAALARRESRGGHYRTDYPAPARAFEKHSVITKGKDEVAFI